MTRRCRHNQCGRPATSWVEHDRHGKIPVCEEHAARFGDRQAVLR